MIEHKLGKPVVWNKPLPKDGHDVFKKNEIGDSNFIPLEVVVLLRDIRSFFGLIKRSYDECDDLLPRIDKILQKGD